MTSFSHPQDSPACRGGEVCLLLDLHPPQKKGFYMVCKNNSIKASELSAVVILLLGKRHSECAQSQQRDVTP